MHFDIYLLTPINPAMVASMLDSMGKDPELFSECKGDAGYLGLNISEGDAADIAEAVFRCKGHATVVSIAYREPRITRDDALKLATESSETRIRENNPDVKFESTVFLDESSHWWRFVTGSQELQERGIVPGALFTHIDKLDGHVWSLMERQLYFVRYYIDVVEHREIEKIKTSIELLFEMEASTDYFDRNKPVMRRRGVMVDVTPHTHARAVERDHGFTPNVLICIRVIPHVSGVEDNLQLMISLLEYFMAAGTNDLIFYIEEFCFNTIIQRKSGILKLNTNYENWKDVRKLFLQAECSEEQLENYIRRR